MVKLSTEQLQEYCDAIFQLETSKYTLGQAEESLQEPLIQKKPKRIVLSAPKMAEVPPPLKPVEPTMPTLDHSKWGRLMAFSGFFAFLGIIFIPVGKSFDSPFIIFCAYFIIACGCSMPISTFFETRYNKKKIIRKFDEETKLYNIELVNYKNSQLLYAEKLKSDEILLQARMAQYLQTQKQKDSDYDTQLRMFHALEKEAEQITRTYKETENQLSTLYEKNVIFPKYRNLVAMSAISEYLTSGRCSQLEGMGGAYNLFEEEIRLNLIITQLNKVVESLEQIKNSQYLLYTQLSAANAILHSISRDVQSTLEEVKDIKADSKKILTFSAITAYCSRVTAENAALIGRLAIVDYLTD